MVSTFSNLRKMNKYFFPLFVLLGISHPGHSHKGSWSTQNSRSLQIQSCPSCEHGYRPWHGLSTCDCDPGWQGECCNETFDICSIVHDEEYDFSYTKRFLPAIPFHERVPESAEFPDEFNFNALVQGALPAIVNTLIVGRCAQLQDSQDQQPPRCTEPSAALIGKLEQLADSSRDGGADGIEFTGAINTIFAFLLLLQEDSLINDFGDLFFDILNCSGLFQGDEIQALNKFERCMLGRTQNFGQNAPTKLSDFQLNTHDSFYQVISPPEEVVNAFFQDSGDTIGKKWMSDDIMFGYMRLAGCNPDMIRRAIPEDIQHNNFPVSNNAHQDAMGDSKTLEDALESGDVFILDFQALEQYEVINNGKILYSPKVLFALDESDVLQAIAIQVYSNPARPNNSIILPPQQRDWSSANLSERVALARWSLAKSAVQSADHAYFQLITHLARTHLVLEPLIIATKRKFSSGHPVRGLLEPHFIGTLPRNEEAHDVLISPDHVIDWLFAPAIGSAQNIAVNSTLEFLHNINDQFLPKTITKRGVEQLPRTYPYRDDALLHWDALHDFIADFLLVNYRDDDDVSNDPELSCWAQELSEKGMMNNFGTNGTNQFRTIEDLQDFLTLFIFTATAQHASINYAQAVFATFVPIMPTSGWTDPNDITEDNVDDLTWTKGMPPYRWQALDHINVLHILGNVHYNILGHYDTQDGDELFDGQYLSAVQSYRQALIGIGIEIEGRNNEDNTLRKDLLPYTLLHPENVPASIHI